MFSLLYFECPQIEKKRSRYIQQYTVACKSCKHINICSSNPSFYDLLLVLLSTHCIDPCLWGGGSPIIQLLVHQPAYPSIWCCCCRPTALTHVCGRSPIIPLLVHQPAYPSIWSAAPSLQRGLSTNDGCDLASNLCK